MSSPDRGWRLCEHGAYAYASCASGSEAFTPRSVHEAYAVYAGPTGADRLVRAVRDARVDDGGVQIRLESRGSFNDIQRLSITLSEAEASREVVYEIRQGVLTTHRSGPQGLAPWTSQELAPSTLCLPLMRNYLGPVIAEIARRPQGTSLVLVPDLRDPRSADVLAPTLSEREARLSGNQVAEIDAAGHTWITQEYSFLGGPYDERSAFWICRDSERLIRYLFTDDSGERWSTELIHLECPYP